MMGRAHTKILERAAQSAGGHYGQLLLRQRHWIEQRAAGRFNDSVLRDWHYKKTPQTVWCIRRLTRATMSSPPDDDSRTAFLLHWASHYFVDALWTCHVAQRYMKGASALEQKEFDNGIEYEVEEIVDTDRAFEARALDGRGYWATFWQGRLESDRRSPALLEAWQRREGYLAISLESVPYCVASFAAYLTFLNHRRGLVVKGDTPTLGATTTPGRATTHRDNAWVVALHQALEQGRAVQWGPDALAQKGRGGPEVDAWLEDIGAAFGTGAASLEHWPGEWVLSQHRSGPELAESVFTPEFAAHIAEMRGFDRSIEQDQRAGLEPTPAAVADRDRQVSTMADWLSRWDVAIDNPALRESELAAGTI